MLLWKLLITGALSGLVLGSILMMVVVYRLAPLLQSRRQRSLRDQHQMPIPRFGGVGMAWAFFGAVWELPAWHRYWESRAGVGKEIPAFAGMTLNPALYVIPAQAGIQPIK